MDIARTPSGIAPAKTGPANTAGRDAAGKDKALDGLSDLMRDISACRNELSRRETAIAGFELRLQSDLRPMQAKMVEIRIDTLRILGRHLNAGWLGRRARSQLESALYDLANELETEFGLDLRQDRNRIFGNVFSSPHENADGESGDSAGEDGNEGDGTFYRESDFPGGSDREAGASSRRGESAGGGARSRPGRKPEAREEIASAGDIRALYLLLARALHPDKEPDAERREAKTGWMQKVIAAYESRDLALLLDILASNPLDAVGPYLSQAPIRTVKGFVKRLRRELEALRGKLAALDLRLDPFLASFIRDGKVNENAYNRHLAEMRKDVKLMRERRDLYRTSQGLKELIEALGTHDWRELL